MSLGPGKSSAAIWTPFQTEVTAETRYPRHSVQVAWTRIKDNSLSFFTIGTSSIGGPDIIQGQLSVITEPDKFQYFDESERVIAIYYDRVHREPLGSFTFATGNVVFDNTTKRFTPNINDTIGTALKRQRPIKIFTGLRVLSQDKILPRLYGLTETPRENKNDRSVSVDVFDYISYINDYELESAMYADQTSDEIISQILQDVGFTTDQFELDTGLNTIGFAWFAKGETAGERIRKIVEAEEGHFYQDEEGLLRFDNRRKFNNLQKSVWSINKEDILEWQTDESSPIINRCIVKAKPREVQSTVEIWNSGAVIEVGHNDSLEVWASFDNPVTAITDPVATTDYLVNTESDGSGTNVTGDVSISITKFTQDAKLIITNNYGGPIFVTFLRLRGTPATIVSEIEELYEDTDSEENYGRQQLIVENDFIDSESFAYYLARTLVRKYKDPLKRVRVTVRAIPHLQIKDFVSLEDMDTGVKGNYRVMRIQGRMTDTEFIQVLTLREINDLEADSPFTIGVSTIDGPDVIWI